MKYLIILFVIIISFSIFAYSMGKLRKSKQLELKRKDLNEIETLIVKLNENIISSDINFLLQYLDELYKDKVNFVAEMIEKSNIIETWKENVRIDNDKAYLNYYNPDEGYHYQINLIKVENSWKIRNIDILR